MKRSQAALEFLTTYAWAFIVITIAVGALYYFGVFDFGKFMQQKCVFPLQFKCIDFSLGPSQVRIKLTNSLGEDIQVTSVQITNDGNPPISCSPSSPFFWPHSTEREITFSSCSGGGYLTNTRVELRVALSYYAVATPTHPTHTINGKINGKVLSS